MAKKKPQLLIWCIFCLFSVGLAGCGGLASPPSSALPSYCRPELLYLLPEPYSRIYIEVDTIEGMERPGKVLEELKDFLGRYCRKPGGIKITDDDLIPKTEYRNRSAEMVANLFMDGPPCETDDGRTAYLYVLFYDSSKMGRQRYCKTPHVDFPYSCAIYYDIDFFRFGKNQVARNFLLHEAGHVLGLCKNTEHEDGAHCVNRGCLMSAMGVSISKCLLGIPMKKLDLCGDCQQDIENMQAKYPVTKMSFNGPFLVRREEGYYVASLPVSDIVSLSGKDTFDCQEMLPRMKQYVRNYEESIQKNASARLHFIQDYRIGDSEEEIDKARAKLVQAQEDPNVSVRNAAIEALRKLEAVRNPNTP